MKKYSQYIIVLFAILLTSISVSSNRFELQSNVVVNQDIDSDTYSTNVNNFLLFNFEDRKHKRAGSEETFHPYLDNFWNIPALLLTKTTNELNLFSNVFWSTFTAKKGLSIAQIIFPFQYFW